MRLMLAVIVVAAGAYATAWTGHRVAASACTADPPGVQIPADVGRSVDLGIKGWDCVLTQRGLEVAVVEMGWWPTDAAAVWAQFSDDGA